MGLDDAEYRQRASAAGKASILLWLVGGLTYVLPALDQHLPPSPRRPRHHRRQPRRAAGALGRLAEGPDPASPDGATPAGAAARGRLGRSRGRQAVVVHQPALARRTRGPCCETAEWGRDVCPPCRAFSYSTCTGATTTRRLRCARRSCLARLPTRTPARTS